MRSSARMLWNISATTSMVAFSLGVSAACLSSLLRSRRAAAARSTLTRVTGTGSAPEWPVEGSPASALSTGAAPAMACCRRGETGITSVAANSSPTRSMMKRLSLPTTPCARMRARASGVAPVIIRVSSWTPDRLPLALDRRPAPSELGELMPPEAGPAGIGDDAR